MTNAPTSADPAEAARRSRGNSTDLLDELRCKAVGVQAQAAYDAGKAPALDDARTRFDAARAAYSDARAAAETQVEQARTQLEGCVDRVTCQLDAADLECLDRAFAAVVERLESCGNGDGCCRPSDHDHDYDEDVRRCDPDDAPGLIAEITQRTEEATACFERLVKEPDPDLPDRVTAAAAEVQRISDLLGGGSWKPAEVYASILVARRRLTTIWRGFTTVNDYTECLGQALTDMVKGHSAIGELTRKTAVQTCYQDAWKSACDRLEKDTVAEVLAEYTRLCAGAGGKPVPSPDDGHPGGGAGRPPGGYPPEQSTGGYGGRPRPDEAGPRGGYGSPPTSGPGGYSQGEEDPEQGYDQAPPPGGPPPDGGPEGPPEPGPGYPGSPRPGGRAPGDRPRASSQGRTPQRPFRDERGRYRSP